MKPIEPVWTVELFSPLSRELLAVLKALQPADWARPTLCTPWTVKDVAAHLLGGNFGRLWQRTGPAVAPQIPGPDYDALVGMINQDNELWVQAARRISPEMLIELLAYTDFRLSEHFRSLDPYQPAGITVAWAGDSLSPNWFDIAREYTEKWLHQQHIRQAVGQPLLLGRKWLFPVLNTFMRALPHTYRAVEAAEGTHISVQITGKAGGTWTLLREKQTWKLLAGEDPGAVCTVRLDQDLAWRLFTRGIRLEEAREQVQIEGNAMLGNQILNMVSIMA